MKEHRVLGSFGEEQHVNEVFLALGKPSPACAIASRTASQSSAARPAGDAASAGAAASRRKTATTPTAYGLSSYLRRCDVVVHQGGAPEPLRGNRRIYAPYGWELARRARDAEAARVRA